MIDTHCHLDQPDYASDRDAVIAACKSRLQAVVTCCANPEHFDLTMQLAREHRGFLKAYLKAILSHQQDLVAIGETGLDFNWITDADGQERQKHLFIEFIALADHLHLPVVVHSRNATAETLNVLEDQNAKAVQMHMFTTPALLNRVLENGWLISVNTLLLRSKTVKRIVRDCPLERMMLETDAPWLGLGQDGSIKPKHVVRNEPTAVHLVAKKIAEIKKLNVLEVDQQTTETAKRFFNLRV
ncbi:hypothetical protein AC480_00555 [miscellaneous Crenarchaeota group archaeon SMTZ1-55]|nr:MAG: hypothetical protein AC480_00555 [miscellaneous Crenarchaeota group archaeon SMTZ1-55]